jgi:hypothetical protein
MGVFLPDPFVDLPCAEFFFADRLEICFEGREVEVPDILFHIVHEGGEDTKKKADALKACGMRLIMNRLWNGIILAGESSACVKAYWLHSISRALAFHIY